MPLINILGGVVPGFKGIAARGFNSDNADPNAMKWDFATDFNTMLSGSPPVANDVVVLAFVSANIASAINRNTPAGWQTGWGEANGVIVNHCIVKRIDGSETTVVLSTTDPTSVDVEATLVGIVYQGGVRTPIIHLDGDGAECTNGDPGFKNMSASGGTVPLVKLAVWGTGGTMNTTHAEWSVDTPDHDIDLLQAAGFTGVWFKDKLFGAGSTPNNNAADMPDRGQFNELGCMWMEF